MPRKKAAVLAAEAEDTPAASSPLADTEAIEDGSGAAAESSASGAGVRSSKAGGFISPAVAKQMRTEGIDQYELPRAVIQRVAKAEVSGLACIGDLPRPDCGFRRHTQDRLSADQSTTQDADQATPHHLHAY